MTYFIKCENWNEGKTYTFYIESRISPRSLLARLQTDTAVLEGAPAYSIASRAPKVEKGRIIALDVYDEDEQNIGSWELDETKTNLPQSGRRWDMDA